MTGRIETAVVSSPETGPGPDDDAYPPSAAETPHGRLALAPRPYRPDPFGPDARRGLHGQVVNRLGLDIVTGIADPGAILLTDELCARFNVSRSLLRESLRVLEGKGLVAARPRVGTRVRPRSDWNLLDATVLQWLVHSPDHKTVMRELLELRSGLEPLAARLAATNADAGDVRTLLDAAEAMGVSTAAADVEGYVTADLEFHHALLAGSRNRPLQQCGVVVNLSLESLAEVWEKQYVNPHDSETHAALARAVEARDPDGAERIMRDIIAQSIERQLARMATEPTP